MAFTVVITEADLRNPLESAETYVRIEWAENCDGVPCRHPGMPDAPPHEHYVISGEFPITAEHQFAIWPE